MKKEIGEGNWKIWEEWGRKSTEIQKQKECEEDEKGLYGMGKEGEC